VSIADTDSSCGVPCKQSRKEVAPFGQLSDQQMPQLAGHLIVVASPLQRRKRREGGKRTCQEAMPCYGAAVT
jgi:hypothetical protein